MRVDRKEKNFRTYALGDSNPVIRKMRGNQQRRMSTGIWEGGKETNQVKKLFKGEGTKQPCQKLLRGWRGKAGN